MAAAFIIALFVQCVAGSYRELEYGILLEDKPGWSVSYTDSLYTYPHQPVIEFTTPGKYSIVFKEKLNIEFLLVGGGGGGGLGYGGGGGGGGVTHEGGSSGQLRTVLAGQTCNVFVGDGGRSDTSSELGNNTATDGGFSSLCSWHVPGGGRGGDRADPEDMPSASFNPSNANGRTGGSGGGAGPGGVPGEPNHNLYGYRGGYPISVNDGNYAAGGGGGCRENGNDAYYIESYGSIGGEGGLGCTEFDDVWAKGGDGCCNRHAPTHPIPRENHGDGGHGGPAEAAGHGGSGYVRLYIRECKNCPYGFSGSAFCDARGTNGNCQQCLPMTFQPAIAYQGCQVCPLDTGNLFGSPGCTDLVLKGGVYPKVPEVLTGFRFPPQAITDYHSHATHHSPLNTHHSPVNTQHSPLNNLMIHETTLVRNGFTVYQSSIDEGQFTPYSESVVMPMNYKFWGSISMNGPASNIFDYHDYTKITSKKPFNQCCNGGGSVAQMTDGNHGFPNIGYTGPWFVIQLPGAIRLTSYRLHTGYPPGTHRGHDSIGQYRMYARNSTQTDSDWVMIHKYLGMNILPEWETPWEVPINMSVAYDMYLLMAESTLSDNTVFNVGYCAICINNPGPLPYSFLKWNLTISEWSLYSEADSLHVCAENYYGHAPNCIQCPPLSTSVVGSTNITDCECRPGYTPYVTTSLISVVSQDTTACTACPAGKFKALKGNSTCISCNVGKYSSIVAADSDTCTSCDAGTYADSIALGTCKGCPIGTYSTIEGSSSPFNCLNCEAGTYSSTSSRFACINCAAGKYSTVHASTTEENCLFCGPGNFSSAGQTTCEICAPGTYTPSRGYASCIQCEPGKYSTVAGLTQAPSGGPFSVSQQQGCSICPRGSFSELPGSTACTACAAGKASPFPAADSSDDCMLCDAGMFSSQEGSSSCTSCGITQYSEVGATNCTNCAADASTNPNDPCYGCPHNRYKYRDSSGATSCEQCPEGAVSPRNSLSITNCTCGKGHSGSDGGPCTACPLGSYKPVVGDSDCIDCTTNSQTVHTGATHSGFCYCNAGYQRNTGTYQCEPCPLNSRRPFAQSHYQCMACPPHETAISADATSCQCDAGYRRVYTLTGGYCEQCDVNYYKDGVGDALSCTQCQTFLSGSISLSKASTSADCICDLGFAFNDDPQTGPNCRACLPGTFSDNRAATACSACPAFSGNSFYGSTSIADCICGTGYMGSALSGCVSCPANSYKQGFTLSNCSCNAGYTREGGDCVACPFDTYKTASGDGQCSVCPENTTTQWTAATSPSHCQCPPGFHGTSPNCEECSAGTYKTYSGNTACEACFEGSTHSLTGSRSVMDCVCGEGLERIYMLGQWRCNPCYHGHYSWEDSNVCVKCPSNSYHFLLGATNASFCQCDPGFEGPKGGPCVEQEQSFSSVERNVSGNSFEVKQNTTAQLRLILGDKALIMRGINLVPGHYIANISNTVYSRNNRRLEELQFVVTNGTKANAIVFYTNRTDDRIAGNNHPPSYHYYSFDSNVTDQNGEFMLMGTPSYSSAKFGDQSVEFTSEGNSALRLPQSFQNFSQYTFSLWVYINQQSSVSDYTKQTILWVGTPNNIGGFTKGGLKIGLQNAGFLVEVQIDSNTLRSGTTPHTPSEWTHIHLTVGADLSMRFYVNSVQKIATNSIPITLDLGNHIQAYLGNRLPDSNCEQYTICDPFFRGRIDDLYIFDDIVSDPVPLYNNTFFTSTFFIYRYYTGAWKIATIHGSQLSVYGKEIDIPTSNLDDPYMFVLPTKYERFRVNNQTFIRTFGSNQSLELQVFQWNSSMQCPPGFGCSSGSPQRCPFGFYPHDSVCTPQQGFHGSGRCAGIGPSGNYFEQGCVPTPGKKFNGDSCGFCSGVWAGDSPFCGKGSIEFCDCPVGQMPNGTKIIGTPLLGKIRVVGALNIIVSLDNPHCPRWQPLEPMPSDNFPNILFGDCSTVPTEDTFLNDMMQYVNVQELWFLDNQFLWQDSGNLRIATLKPTLVRTMRSITGTVTHASFHHSRYYLRLGGKVVHFAQSELDSEANFTTTMWDGITYCAGREYTVLNGKVYLNGSVVADANTTGCLADKTLWYYEDVLPFPGVRALEGHHSLFYGNFEHYAPEIALFYTTNPFVYVVPRTECVPCDKGQFCTGNGFQPKRCAGDFTTPYTGLSTAHNCQCPSFLSSNPYVYTCSGVSLKSCGGGYYRRHGRCNECPQGFYCDGQTVHRCPGGTIPPPLIASLQDCYRTTAVVRQANCSAGYYCHDGLTIACPPFFTSPPNSISSDDCTCIFPWSGRCQCIPGPHHCSEAHLLFSDCPVGFWGEDCTPNDGITVAGDPCPMHHYCEKGNVIPCSNGKVTLYTGAISEQECLCATGTFSASQICHAKQETVLPNATTAAFHKGTLFYSDGMPCVKTVHKLWNISYAGRCHNTYCGPDRFSGHRARMRLCHVVGIAITGDYLRITDQTPEETKIYEVSLQTGLVSSVGGVDSHQPFQSLSEPYYSEGTKVIIEHSRCESGECVRCPANSFCINGTAFLCPRNSTSPPGSKSVSDCACITNFYGTDGDCNYCGVNKISSGALTDSECYCKKDWARGTAAGECHRCVGDATAVSRDISCRCFPGFRSTSNGCVQCSPGWYCPDGERSILCPQHHTSIPGSALKTQCVILPGFYRQNQFVFPECLQDHYCDASTPEGNMQPCPNGSSSALGATSIANCSCSTGEYLQDGCQSCPPNFYCNGRELIFCGAAAESPPRSSSIENCTCTEGTFQGRSRCWACGYNAYCIDSKRYVCPSGSFTKTERATRLAQCVCDRGFLTGEDGGCYPCPADHFCPYPPPEPEPTPEWEPCKEGVTRTYNVTTTGNNSFFFRGDAYGNNPTLLVRPTDLLVFNLNVNNHPFTLTSSRDWYSRWNSPLYGIINDKITQGTLTYTLPENPYSTMYYATTNSSMPEVFFDMHGIIRAESCPPQLGPGIEPCRPGRVRTYSVTIGTGLYGTTQITVYAFTGDVENMNQYLIPQMSVHALDTLVFHLNVDGEPFYLSTSSSTSGALQIDNNGGTQGTITYQIPEDSPQTLWYVSGNKYYLRAKINVLECPETPPPPPPPTTVIPCPPHSTTPSMSYNISQCRCKDSFYREGDTCHLCPAGFYCQQGERFECPLGTSPAGASSDDDCQCGDGFEEQRWGYRRECVPCPLGSYCTDGLVTTCPAGSVGLQRGLTSSQQCVCDKGFRGVGGVCTACPLNTYSEGANSSCLCKRGFYVLDGECVTCPEGAYCTDGVEVTICPENATSESGAGFLSECVCAEGLHRVGSECVACPEKHYCHASKSFPCPTGATSTGVECLCPNGTYSVGFSCPECPLGYYCHSHRTHQCPAGKRTLFAGASSVNDCVCAAGYHADSQHQCLPCDESTYCPDGVQRLPCPNLTTSFPPRESASDCRCGDGKQLVLGDCEPCSANFLCFNGTRERCPPLATSPVGSSRVSECVCIAPYQLSGADTCTLRSDASQCTFFHLEPVPVLSGFFLVTDRNEHMHKSGNEFGVDRTYGLNNGRISLPNTITAVVEPTQLERVYPMSFAGDEGQMRTYGFNPDSPTIVDIGDLPVQPDYLLGQGGFIWSIYHLNITYLQRNRMHFAAFRHRIQAPHKQGDYLWVYNTAGSLDKYFIGDTPQLNHTMVPEQSCESPPLNATGYHDGNTYGLTEGLLMVFDLQTCKMSAISTPPALLRMTSTPTQLILYTSGIAFRLVKECRICAEVHDCFACSGATFLSPQCSDRAEVAQTSYSPVKMVLPVVKAIALRRETTTLTTTTQSSSKLLATTTAAAQDPPITTTHHHRSNTPTTTPPPVATTEIANTTTILPETTVPQTLPLDFAFRRSQTPQPFVSADEFTSLAQKIITLAVMATIILFFVAVVARRLHKRTRKQIVIVPGKGSARRGR